MTEQEQTTEQTSPWQFAPEYEARFAELPPSQRREALKRLTGRRRNPLSPEQCAQPSAEVEACLEAVQKAYWSKKARSKASSAVKRLIQKANPEPAEVEPEAELEAEAVDAVAAISLEPAIIVAEPEPAPEPTPAPARVTAPPAVVVAQAQPKSLPISIPTPAAKKPAASPAPVVVPVVKPAAQKSGLSAMLKR